MQNVSKFITILHQNFAITQTAFLKPSTSKPHCIFLACFCHLGLNCMHENRTGAVFIHLLNVFALSLQIQYKSSHWVYNCDYHRPALICPDMSPRADKVLCKNISEIWTRNLSNWIVAKLYIGWTILHLETANFWYWFLS